eukprot:TRINITY_DN1882_c0_g1_i1.p4 TRINITY_DN1882_c0_g1~~TRINITY_DN1882_c0_g1_i1.p4  ORF type:complete len:107 (-),score=27.91 TRINITY_DN1882_c0_g1_i1:213-533(-)
MVNGHPLVVVPRPVPFARPAPPPCTTCMAPPPPSPCNACGTATTTSFGMGGLDPFAATSTFGAPFGSATTFGAPFGSTPTTTTFGAPFGATPFSTSYNAAPFPAAF